MVGRAVAVADGAAARLGVAVGGARRARPLVGVVPLKKKEPSSPGKKESSTSRARRELNVVKLR